MDSETTIDVGRLITAARGDADALGRLLERYRGYLTLLARVQIGRRLRGKADPVDLVQDTFLEAHRGFALFRGETEAIFLAWLRRVLATQTARLVRRYSGTRSRDIDLERTLELELDASSGVLDRGLVATGDSPSGDAVRREHAVLLADALDRLPDDYREAIVLRQLEGLAFEDVAARMGRSVDAVQKLWVRGLDQLRLLVEGLG